MTALELITPNWDAPENLRGFVTTRRGGVSLPPYDSLNLADHVGDAAEAVEQNRHILRDSLPDQLSWQWLQQVHGTDVVEIESASEPITADALITRVPGVACCVLTADCLPVFIASESGDEIALIHAGWRGMADGIIENTLAKLSSPAARLLAWLGPAIGPCHFEVGPEVRERFVQRDGEELNACFRGSPQSDRLLADLYGIASSKLGRLGVSRVSQGDYCTYCDSDRFYSYRRQGSSGRMLSLIYLG